MSSHSNLLEPFLPYDIIYPILSLLALEDYLAFSSVSHAARSAALAMDSCLPCFVVKWKNVWKARNVLEKAAPSFRTAVKCVSLPSTHLDSI
jgi:hypothetical protein